MSRSPRFSVRACTPSAIALTVVLVASGLLMLSVPHRASAAGSPDSTFGTGGFTTVADSAHGSATADKGATSVVETSDHKFVISGTGGDDISQSDAYIERFNSDGKIDQNFGTSGLVDFGQTSFTGGYFEPSAGVVEAAGSTYVGGAFFNAGTSLPEFAVVKLQPDGSLDSSFGTNGLAVAQPSTAGSLNSYATSIIVDSTGTRLLVGGPADAADGSTDAAVVAFDMSLGASTPVPGIVSGLATVPMKGDPVVKLGLDSARNIDVLAQTTDGPKVTRLTSSGAIDPTFNSKKALIVPLSASDSQGTSLLVRDDNSLIVAGYGSYSSSTGTRPCLALAHISAAGAIDTNYGGAALGYAHACVGPTDAFSWGYAAAQNSGGDSTYIAGLLRTSTDAPLVARFSDTGILDTNYGAGGDVATVTIDDHAHANAITVDTAGNPVIAGLSTNKAPDDTWHMFIARFTGTGAGTPPSVPSNTRLPYTQTVDASIGGEVSGFVGTWTPASGVSYTWKWVSCPDANGYAASRCQDLTSGTGTTVTPLFLNTNVTDKYVYLWVKASNSVGSLVAASTGVGPISPSLRPVNRSAPTVSGQPLVGAAINGTIGTWNTFDELIAQWYRCPGRSFSTESCQLARAAGFISGYADMASATRSVEPYTLTTADLGKYMYLLTTAGGLQNSGVVSATSSPFGPVQQIVVAPAISGNHPALLHAASPLRPGGKVTASLGTWTGTQPIRLTYSWLSCPDTLVSHCRATGTYDKPYTVTTGDIGHRILLVVTAFNTGHNARAFSRYFSPLVQDFPKVVAKRTSEAKTVATTVLKTVAKSTSKKPTVPLSSILAHNAASKPNVSLGSPGQVYISISANLRGGNVIAAGGGNLLGNGGHVIAAGGGNVIAAGGGNMVGSLHRLGLRGARAHKVAAKTKGKKKAAGKKKPAGTKKPAASCGASANGKHKNKGKKNSKKKGAHAKTSHHRGGLVARVKKGKHAKGKASGKHAKGKAKGKHAKGKAKGCGKAKPKVQKAVVLVKAVHVFRHAGHARLKLTLTKTGRKVLRAWQKKAKKARRKHQHIAPLRVRLTVAVSPLKGAANAGVGVSGYSTKVIILTL